MRVALASKPRSATVAAPTAVLEPFSLFEIGTTFAFTTGRLRRNCSVVCSPDLLMLSRLKSKTGFGPTASAVGMFEPVTMTRSASAVAGVGAAPGGGGGGGFCANAFDAIMRGTPTQAARAMRRNSNLESPLLVIVSPLVRLALRYGIKKNSTGWQDYFSLFGNIFAGSPKQRIDEEM